MLLRLLDAMLIATSFFNTLVMLWLGLTVLLNAERRGLGTWAASSGLLLGAAFFAVHSSVVAQTVWNVGFEMAVWWRVGWAPFVAAPFLWYAVMTWYSGALRLQGHRAALAATGVVGTMALTLLVVASPVPSYEAIISRAQVPVLSIGPLPVVVLVYPAFSVLCVVLALLVLRRPPLSTRFMGDLGRERARPWLIAASWGLLAVGLVAGGGVGWLLDRVRSGTAPTLSSRSLLAIIAFDLVLSLLIAVIAVLIGQAVVAYEIFTGKTLPRGGLASYWRGGLLLAICFSLLVGVGLAMPIDPAHVLVANALLVATAYALFCWRAFVEREQDVSRLRPLVASQHLYDHALDAQPLPASAAAAPLQALCDEVLDARVAFLVPLGAVAGLAPAAVAGASRVLPTQLAELVPQLHATPQQLYLPIDPDLFAGAGWAVPLWSERGLIGMLLIGPRRDNGLYTQEQIETARAGAERLLDSEASAELARRLLALQRQRLAESYVLDRRTRRVLHDDVLPRLHAGLLQIAVCKAQIAGESEATAFSALQTELSAVHQDISNLLHALPSSAEPELLRLGLAGALNQLVEGEMRGAFDHVVWQVAPEAADAAAQLPPLNAEVVFYAVRELLRNAAHHGRGSDQGRYLEIEVSILLRTPPRGVPYLHLRICDTGIGMRASASTHRSGQGLILHSTLLAVISGTLVHGPRSGGGTCVTIELPCL